MAEELKSARGLMETPETGIIVAGGPSSSELLNRFKDAVIEDLVELDTRTSELAEGLSLAATVFQAQLSALASRLSSLEARLPTTPASSWVADFFTEDLLHASNGAEVNTVYGQATLPILNSQDKLIALDTAGRVFVPRNSQMHYSYQSSAPTEVQWLYDENHVYALDQRSDTAWWRNRDTSGTVWVRVKVPANLNANRLSNCIILHPFPALHMDLLSVEYRNPAGSWTTADLSYLEGWSSSQSRVEWFGNVRLFIPQSAVTELRIKLSVPAGPWGFSQIALRQVEFSPSATLALDYTPYATGNLGEATLLGKDQATLAYLTRSINGDEVTIQLTQNSANSSPVLTGVEVER